MPANIISITFEKESMKHKDGHFSIPASVCGLLGLSHDDEIHMIITHPHGGFLFAGNWQMKSGYEIYGKEFAGRIKAGEKIRVTVSKPVN